uniref:Uncharacterized protein n=1 Tax=Homalodisca liturata TaxID=320908 RepID=A0A1B6J1R6_9HEMI
MTVNVVSENAGTIGVLMDKHRVHHQDIRVKIKEIVVMENALITFAKTCTHPVRSQLHQLKNNASRLVRNVRLMKSAVQKVALTINVHPRGLVKKKEKIA